MARTRTVVLSLAALMLMLCTQAQAGTCKEPRLAGVSEEHPECRFFAGTRLFREKNFTGAKANWEAVLSSTEDDKEIQRLRMDASNNLGYLLYMGLGVKADRRRALELWEVAARSGQEESSYHLCHALGDATEPEYRPKAALPHCQEALRRYEQSTAKNASTETIRRQLRTYIGRLGGG